MNKSLTSLLWIGAAALAMAGCTDRSAEQARQLQRAADDQADAIRKEAEAKSDQIKAQADGMKAQAEQHAEAVKDQGERRADQLERTADQKADAIKRTDDEPRQGAGTVARVDEAQRRLKNLGFYDGQIDGRMSSETRAAIGKFQEREGISRTRELDDTTWMRLSRHSG
jgi:gas vesicle protein